MNCVERADSQARYWLYVADALRSGNGPRKPRNPDPPFERDWYLGTNNGKGFVSELNSEISSSRIELSIKPNVHTSSQRV